jgi:hypothetical protein
VEDVVGGAEGVGGPKVVGTIGHHILSRGVWLPSALLEHELGGGEPQAAPALPLIARHL